jgi:Flp pilus assembly protein TadG
MMNCWRRLKSDRGTAILETAMTLPLVLLVSVSVFEFGRAYQTWQVLTNAAREGARVAVLPGSTAADVDARVRQYLTSGALPAPASAGVALTAGTVDIGAGGAGAPTSVVTVTYPFSFIVLQPVAQLVVTGSTLGSAVTLTARAEMRNE